MSPGRADYRLSALAGAAFGYSLGAATLVFPLLALRAGFSAVLVGLLATVSAVVQLGVRLFLPWFLSVASTRRVAALGALLLFFSEAALLSSTLLVGFVAAQVLQGAARSLFWTACQAHMTQDRARASRRLASFQLSCSLGGVAGPASTGAIATGLSLWAGVVIAMVGAAVCVTALSFVEHRAPYRRLPRSARGASRRVPELRTACWASFAAGGWRGALESYVPVVLATGGVGAGAIGLMAASSDAASMASNAWLARFRPSRVSALIRASAVVLFISSVSFPFTTGEIVLATAVLAAGGATSGLLTVLGLAAASENVDASEQGAAISLAGTYRAGARLLSPSATGAVAAALPIPVAMSLVGVAVTVPSILTGRRTCLDRRPGVARGETNR